MGDNQDAGSVRAGYIELAGAVLLIPEGAAGPAAKAAQVLTEEVEKRTGIRLPVVHAWPKDGRPVIAAGSEASLRSLLQETDAAGHLEQLEAPGREGYRLLAHQEGSDAALIVGADDRGTLFGIGKFLRKAKLASGTILLAAGTAMSSTPRQRIRGHQLGYRPKTNAYDAWSPEQFDQYIRELALFGANSIEIMPPRTDDDATGPLMKVEPMEMMVRLSETIESYGLDTWVWYPNMAHNYEDPDTVRAEVAEREHIFSRVPHIHAVFIPGSDPGELQPKLLFEWSEQVSGLLRKYHPDARVWLSPQFMGYEQRQWLDGFLAELEKEPEWLGGIVFGPHVDMTLPELRKRVPERYPIRRYEDITHNFHCQYPVQNWDVAYALTLGRESINPRPIAQKHIHNLLESYASGNLSYSEGINDDVNKFVWSDQDWNSQTPVIETLREFANLFIGDAFAEGVAQGLLALERNWEGPLLVNASVEETLRQWQRMERSAPPEVLNNYRFQMGLLRAYYDAYIRRRLVYETELEQEAMDALRLAPSTGSLAAIERMEEMLRRAASQPVASALKARCWELADELFLNIGEQLSVVKHQAIALGRGAFMDAIDFPLNDSAWLLSQCAGIKRMPEETERLAAIDRLVNRTNPGPGGYYDNLGSYQGWQRVDPGKGWIGDPGYLQSPRMAHGIYLLQKDRMDDVADAPPIASVRHANTLADTELSMTYDHLDADSAYSIKVTYVGDTASELVRDYEVTLIANGTRIVHENVPVKQGRCTEIVSELPRGTITDGRLRLTWKRTSGFKRLNVSEVWIMRQDG